jgi:hypothetical protein
MSGFVFYEGPSQIDRKPIVAIATLKSKNDKTGNLVQTWILRADQNPIQAINSGADASICGKCPLRGKVRPIAEKLDPVSEMDGDTTNKFRTCYVLPHTAPLQVFKKWQMGGYSSMNETHLPLLAERGLRYGSYGDPTAVPRKGWQSLDAACTGRSKPGYSHQWRLKRFQPWSTRLMASTHSEQENVMVWSAGWRTFRTVASVDDVMPEEIICPASAEGGNKSNCAKCGLCNGKKGPSDTRRNIAIVVHGTHNKQVMLRRTISLAMVK